ncbi:MAG TPA: DUF2934 domain-containing protein [Nitrospirales bacterium]|nr:DUF2934 domain-containing protein [Nitrospirales bacterium]
MSRQRVLATSERKEPEEPSGATRQSRRMTDKQPRAKTSSRGKNRKPLRPEQEHDGETSFANEGIYPRIAERAYELYQRRGGHHGQDLDDWFLAEQEVMAEETRENIEP